MENNTAPALNIVKTATQSVQENLKDLKKHQGIGYRALSILLSFVFFAFYSKLLFTIFMASEGFFSYDMLLHGNIGLSTFFITTEIFVVIVAILTMGALIPIGSAIKTHFYRKNLLKKDYIFIQILNFSLFFMILKLNISFTSSVYQTAIESNETDIGIYKLLLTISATICVYISLLIFSSAKYNLATLSVVLALTFTVTLLSQKEASALFQFGLQYFGIGGNLPVEIQMKSGHIETKIEGNLVFLSPQNIYLSREDVPEKLTIIPTERTEYITVKSRPKLAKKEDSQKSTPE